MASSIAKGFPKFKTSLPKKPKINKYGAVRTARGFPSRLEEAVYDLHCLRVKAGEIKNLQRQQTIVLQDGPPNVRIAWKVDFSYQFTATKERGNSEAKGIEDGEYRLKLKLYRKNPPARLEIWKGTYAKPVLVETIEKGVA